MAEIVNKQKDLSKKELKQVSGGGGVRLKPVVQKKDNLPKVEPKKRRHWRQM